MRITLSTHRPNVHESFALDIGAFQDDHEDMRILVIAPQPFFQERGTPIAVRLLVQRLSALGHVVDIATWHLGATPSYPNVTVRRIFRVPFIRKVRPGFSAAKLICDLLLGFLCVRLAWTRRYEVYHAVEEGVFIAHFLRLFTRAAVVYDMDSSMPLQIVESAPQVRFVLPLLQRLERWAIRKATGVLCVCDALAEIAHAAGAQRVAVLRDCSLLPDDYDPNLHSPPLRQTAVRLLYVGNLEPYQGVDLLLDAFHFARQKHQDLLLTIAGGSPPEIARYAARAAALGLSDAVRFLGATPLSALPALMADADILVSPRLKGNNTPMKIYTYLDSGKAVLATDLPTHRQALSSHIARLAPPEPMPFAQAMLDLARHPEERARLGRNGRTQARAFHSKTAFEKTVDAFYAALEQDLKSKRILAGS